MTKHTLNYNLFAILLEKFKTVDIDKVAAPRAGYSRNVLDPVAAMPGGKAQMTFDDVKIKRGEKGFKKGKYTKDPKSKRWAPKEKPTGPEKTDLAPDYFDNKPEKMTTAMVPYKPEAPATDVKKPAAPKIKKPGISSRPDELYKTGDSDYTFMTAYDPDRFKKLGGAVKGAQGVEAGPFERFNPRLISILIGD